MRRFGFGRRSVRLFVLVFASVMLTAGVAVATTLISNAYTDSNGVYHGCVSNAVGTLRVVMPGDACRANETAIDWSRTGPQGPQGVKGDPGAPGPKGDPGAGVVKTDVATTTATDGRSSLLLALPNGLVATLAGCTSDPWGHFDSHVEITNSGNDDLRYAGLPIAPGAPANPLLFMPLMDDDTVLHEPSGTSTAFVDWSTRQTVTIFVNAFHHTVDPDGTVRCGARAFAIING